MPADGSKVLAVFVTLEAEGSEDIRKLRKARESWIIHTEKDATIEDVFASSLVVSRGDPLKRWSRDAGTGYDVPGETLNDKVVCQFFTIRRRPNSKNVWDGVADYEGLVDITALAPQVRYRFTQREEWSPFDAAGVVKTNSAGDPYEGGTVRRRRRLTVQCTAYAALDSINPNTLGAFNDTRNQSAFTLPGPKGALPGPITMPAGSALLTFEEPDFEEQTAAQDPANSQWYWKITSLIEFDQTQYKDNDGNWQDTLWQTVVPDEGYRKINPFTNERIPILIGGSKPSSPVLLDGSGGVLAEGASAKVRVFQDYPLADWSGIAALIGGW